MIDIRHLGGVAALAGFVAVFAPASANACVAVEDEVVVAFCAGEGVVSKPQVIDDILDDVVERAFNLDGGGGAASPALAVVPPLAVFASGQWARVSHDGFDISMPGFSGSFPGPSFTAEDFSAVVSLDFNAAKHFGFEDRYGLNIGLFGGYTSTEADFDPWFGLDVGSATNEAGMFGTYGLFRQGMNYMLASVTTFVGNTDVSTPFSSASYDTLGYAGTLSAGRIFVLADNVRFDLRGGIIGVTFTGDPYSDSGFGVGESRISFGAVKFEPGVYMVHPLENGMVFSPYARLELQQRFGYRNRVSVDGTEFEFDDGDFSVSLSGGFNLKVSDSTTVSSEIRGKASADSTTVAGKIGLKIAF